MKYQVTFFLKDASNQHKAFLTIGFLLLFASPSYANELGKMLHGGLETLLFFAGLIMFAIFLLITLTYRYPKYNFYTALHFLLFILIFQTPKLQALLPNNILMVLIGLQAVAGIGITFVKLADKRVERLRKRA